MPTLTEPQPTSEPPRFRWYMPWRCATAGWVVVVLALLIGVPFFLCLPPWVDVTLYDMATRSILRGGVYYRDVFDTNLPGVAWTMAVVRSLFGWSYEVLRTFDLLVISAEVALLLLWVRRAGAAKYTVAWLAAAAALYYPYTSEFSHMQRDAWMLLPALVAARMRLRRVTKEPNPPTPVFVLSPSPLGGGVGEGSSVPEPNPPTPFPGKEGGAGFSPSPLEGGVGEGSSSYRSLLEGFVWGLAVWIKPHVVIPAFFVWVASARVIARHEPARRRWADLGLLLLGGILCGGAGVAWLVGTGAWPFFTDIFLNWNPNYVATVFDEVDHRFFYTFEVFRPWGLLHNVAMPLALLAMWSGWRKPRQRGATTRWQRLHSWVYLPAETEAVATARLLLAALYLGWLAQVILFQKGFEYAQVPVLLLGMAVIATHRWAIGFLYLLWFVFLGLLLNFTSLVPRDQDPAPGLPAVRLEHYGVLTNPDMLKLWPRCWREGSSPELRDRLAIYTNIHCGVNWEELHDVADFLQAIDPPLQNRELNCWNDSTHSLYLTLNLDPATRYMHYGTVFDIISENDWIKKRLAKEVTESPQRYVVADLARLVQSRTKPHQAGPDGDTQKLPAWFPIWQHKRFPWNQKLVFRSGRYVVYEVVNREFGRIDIPSWPPFVEPEDPR